MFSIARIYVPVKRRATLDPAKVQTIAESIMETGQKAPILVRRDGDKGPRRSVGLFMNLGFQECWRCSPAAAALEGHASWLILQPYCTEVGLPSVAPRDNARMML